MENTNNIPPEKTPVLMRDAWEAGHVFLARSERFGDNVLLCIRCTGTSGEEKYRACPIRNGKICETLYQSSYDRDVVLDSYGTYEDYVRKNIEAGVKIGGRF